MDNSSPARKLIDTLATLLDDHYLNYIIHGVCILLGALFIGKDKVFK